MGVAAARYQLWESPISKIGGISAESNRRTETAVVEPFLDSLKNVVPSLEKATEVNFLLLLTSFVLLADCSALYVHGMNILHLSEVPDVIKPRLAIEAMILVIGFGMFVIAMRFLKVFADVAITETVGRLWVRFEIWSDPDGQRFGRDSADSVPVFELRKKAHASKERYYLDLLKEAEEAEEEENEHRHNMRQTALYAFTALMLAGVNLFVPLSANGTGILAQIADGLGQNGYGWLFFLGCILMALAFYPIFAEHQGKMIYCPELAGELEEKRRQRREEEERFQREIEIRRASSPGRLSDIGEPLSRSMRRNSVTSSKADD